MKCHCCQDKYVWDLEGATFYCLECKETHRMCCAVYTNYLCGEVDSHDGDHVGVFSRVTWNNQVYEKSMGS